MNETTLGKSQVLLISMMLVPSTEQELSLLNEKNVLLQKLEDWVFSTGFGTNQKVPLWAYVK